MARGIMTCGFIASRRKALYIAWFGRRWIRSSRVNTATSSQCRLRLYSFRMLFLLFLAPAQSGDVVPEPRQQLIISDNIYILRSRVQQFKILPRWSVALKLRRVSREYYS